MKIEILERKAHTIIGSLMECDSKQPTSFMAVWEKHWKDIESYAKNGIFYGYSYHSEAQKKDHPHMYMYLVSVDYDAEKKYPETMVKKEILAGLYAKVTHIGPVVKLIDTYMHVFQKWLPESKYILPEHICIERYDDRYEEKADDSEIDIYFPLQKKEQSQT